MKKLVFTITTYLGLISIIFAQNDLETINWIKNNKQKIESIDCPSRRLLSDELSITKKSIIVFDDYQTCEIKINSINTINLNDNYIYIISDEKIDGEPLTIKFKLNNPLKVEDEKHHITKVIHHKTNHS